MPSFQKSAALALCLLTVSARADAPRFSVTDLGVPPSFHAVSDPYGTEMMARGINAKGEVVGQFNEMAFVWRQGKLTNLGVLPSSWADDSGSHGNAINAHGEIVGGSGGFGPIFMGGLYDCRAFFWRDGKIKPLAASAGFSSFEAFGVNDRQEVVGLSGYRGFYYSQGKYVELPTLSHVPAGNRAQANAINAKADVVGFSTVGVVRDKLTRTLYNHATLWQRHGKTWTARDLGTLPGFTNSAAVAVNDFGIIVGQAEAFAFIWKRGKMTALPNLPGRANSRANGINDKGQIVGACSGRAVLWEREKPTDLNALLPPKSGWILTTANAINAKGWIVGDGLHDGKARGFFLRPR